MTLEAAAPDQRESVDAFLGGRVTLVQPKRGHRAGLDAALLQALAPADASGHAVDLGAGVGAVAFAVAARAPQLTVTAVEREPSLLALGRKALRRSENAGFADRVTMMEADAGALTGFSRHTADWVLMNPPFDAPKHMPGSPDELRRRAHIAVEGLLQSWVTTSAFLLKASGMLGLIYRAEGLLHVLAALESRFGDIGIVPVHPASDRPAIRILVRARRESRAPLRVMPGLVLHREDGGWTVEADAILRGRAELSM